MSYNPDFNYEDLTTLHRISTTIAIMDDCLDSIKPDFSSLFGYPYTRDCERIKQIPRENRYAMWTDSIIGDEYSEVLVSFDMRNDNSPNLYIQLYIRDHHRLYKQIKYSVQRSESLKKFIVNEDGYGMTIYCEEPLSNFISSKNQKNAIQLWFKMKMKLIRDYMLLSSLLWRIPTISTILSAPSESQVVAILMDKASQGGFDAATTLPSIKLSREVPPIFEKYPDLECSDEPSEQISIENLLGVYRCRSKKIVLFERGIDWYCQWHSCNKGKLLEVVLIHELGHWIMHQLPKPGVPLWNTKLYEQGETELHEGWAQLMTYWVAETVKGDFKHVFEQLNDQQSPAYRVYKKFRNRSVVNVMGSLVKWRSMKRPAGIRDW